ncbi:hypothetical protein DTL42_13590 [Bremerella cremea]|uniref:Uncharacterized protein n=1 Tax=Bremerella cremea TaxID=1031537 RepID=A0A368KSX0_9BACT|nr:Lpg1974 family pore-forming outer membrane protein [Bremerella cremea]RCS48233.1 hypothetical protein DTL42_13590 [Bremerella cremea]
MIRNFTCLFFLLLSAASAAAEGVTPFAEAIVWHASAETSSVWASEVPLLAREFEANNLEFGWNTGFRAGIEFKPTEWLWDVRFTVTHFATSQDASIADGLNLVIPEFFSGFLSGDSFDFTTASVDWSIKYTTFDWDIGHDIEVAPTCVIRPTFGLKAAIINQNIHSNWADFFGVSAVENVRHEFFGIGPSAGVGARWNPGMGNLSLVGDLSGALLYGVWNVEDDFRRTDGGAPSSSYEAFSTSMNDSKLGTVMLRSFFGAEWRLPCRATVVGRVGYEMQWWANQQRLLTFQQLPMHGDLTFQGGVCGIAVSY